MNKAVAARITHILTTCCRNESHVRQIQAQVLVHNLRSDTTVAYHFIMACQSANLLVSAALPLYLDGRKKPHTFVCNSLLKAFAHSSDHDKSWVIYCFMHRNSISVNNYSFPFVLKALADMRLIQGGDLLHAQIRKLGFFTDIYVGNSLMNVYSAFGNMDFCRKVFDEMLLKDVVSWTIMISGFKNLGKFHDALIAFDSMTREGVMPNQVTAVNALAACAGCGVLDMGLWIHEQVKKNKWELDVILGTSLIGMYAKCGRIHEALQVFNQIKEKNLFSWNAIIRGLALSKNAEEAVNLFFKMKEEGIAPDEGTLVAVLIACVHSGLLHKAQHIFSSLANGEYGISPSIKHYNCMVDLLARSKHLGEALRLIREMPFQSTVSTWGALVSGCRAEGNYELCESAAWKLVQMEPHNSAHYVLLSNVYADQGKWSVVDKVRQMMKETGLKKGMSISSLCG